MQKTIWAPGLLALAALTSCADSGRIADPSPRFGAAATERLYDVTITNLTQGQPFSPGVVATHGPDVDVFTIGGKASEGIRLIAEDGDPAQSVAELTGLAGVHAVIGTTAPIHRRGGPGPTSLTVRIAATERADRLSLAVMLICTNDGFTGVHGVALPRNFTPVEFLTNGYDAGTEMNNQRLTDIVDPCGGIGPLVVLPDGSNFRVATDGIIRFHPGIGLRGDLVRRVHGWDNPVAKVTVRKVE